MPPSITDWISAISSATAAGAALYAAAHSPFKNND
jgi:hypothetical protein